MIDARVNLNNLVRDAVVNTRHLWKHVAELELDLDPDLPTLSCSRAEINQMLLSLIANAAEAIAESIPCRAGGLGQITLRTGTDGKNIVVEIEHTGCGYPGGIRNRVFDSSCRPTEVDAACYSKLAGCYNVIVKKHQGAMEVITEPGIGTTFQVTLPRFRKPALASSDLDVVDLRWGVESV